MCLYVVYAVVVISGRYIRLQMMRNRCSPILEQEEGGDKEEECQGTEEEGERGNVDPHLRRVDSVVEEANWRYDVFHTGDGTVRQRISPPGNDSTSGVPYGRLNEGRSPRLRQEISAWLWDLWKAARPFCLQTWKDALWPQRIFILLKSPITLILNVTIPTVNLDMQKQNWSRSLTMVQAIIAPLFALVAIRKTNYLIQGWFPLWVLVLMVGCFLSCAVLLFSNPVSPPIFHKWLAYAGFLMSVLWIYTIATETVGIIIMIGAVSGAPEEILGLTLLAWSNSLGDLITDLSVARQGFPRMAISACFGGPLFNLLLGIGIPFTIATIRESTHFFSVCFSSLALILISFLVWSLISSLVLLPVSGFRATRPYAIYLLVIYGAFLLTASLTALGVINSIPVPIF